MLERWHALVSIACRRAHSISFLPGRAPRCRPSLTPDLVLQERIKEEYPEAASNYVTASFVSGHELRARTTAKA